jgi:anti-sigma-K factor RskA
MSDHVTPHPDLAGYVLGVLDQDEQDSFELHLATCTQCREEVAELSSLPDLLMSTEVQPPPDLQIRTLAAIERAAMEDAEPAPARQTRRKPSTGWFGVSWLRPVFTGAAAAAVLLIAVVAVMLVGGQGGGAVQNIELVSASGGTAHGTAQVRETENGLTVRMSVSGLPETPPDQVLECWFVGPGDTLEHPNRVSAGTFRVGASGEATVEMSAGADLSKFPKLGVTAEPKDGNPAREGPKVLVSQ